MTLSIPLAASALAAPALLAASAGASPCAEHGGPGRRSGAMVAWHARHGRIVVFGGRGDRADDPYPRSLWAWDGRRWTCLDGGAAAPPGRADGELAYDAARGRLVLYGGRVVGRGVEILRDTWEWDGAAWRLADSVGPPPRMHAVLGYDPSRRAMLLHGGLSAIMPPRRLVDTWRWNGGAWVPAGVDSSTATVASDHDVALLATPDGMLRVEVAHDSAAGCVSDRSWQRGVPRAFALVGDRWVARGARDAPGPCFGGGAPAAWTRRGLVMLVEWNAEAPATPAATWLWRAGRWTRAAVASPPPRRGGRMAYDARRDRAVLYGGDDDGGPRDDVWEWDGHRWHRRTP